MHNDQAATGMYLPCGGGVAMIPGIVATGRIARTRGARPESGAIGELRSRGWARDIPQHRGRLGVARFQAGRAGAVQRAAARRTP